MITYKINNLTFTAETENSISEQTLELIEQGQVSKYRLKLRFDSEQSPKPYSLIWEEDQIDMLAFWMPLSFFQHNITPDWSMRCAEGRTAAGMPLMTIYNKKGINRVTISLSDPSSPSTILAGVVEENGKVRFRIDLFSQLCAKMKEYEVIIRIDRRPIAFADAVSGVREWWNELGYGCTRVPVSAKLPMYSTWYGFHQSTIPDEIIKECKIAKEYGMDTVIVDDGWQTEDNSRGYAYCGDWQISKSKIPDMKSFVDQIHALGMKFMIWFSVPFVGFESKNHERFKGMYLGERPHMKASVLDPRFKEVRDFLVDTYQAYVEKYGWDGLKLDFIDSFKLTDESSTDYEKMDTISLEEAVEKLLGEICARLKAINPEFLIEFRQSYVGPIVSKYGNIFRVADCPNDALFNRIGSLNLKLTSDKIAVHSDMLMWNKDETPEAVMYQLLSVMFAVPQISIRFDSITEEHKRLLKTYLDFWRTHRETLLDGKLELQDTDGNYSLAKSTAEDESVCVLYQSVVACVDDNITSYIFNSTGKDYIYIECSESKEYELYNMLGEKYSSGALSRGVHKIALKNCGMIKLIASKEQL